MVISGTRLSTPLSEEAVRSLELGETVLVSGTIHTARDMAHTRMADAAPGDMPFSIAGGVVYHCGPIVLRRNGQWEVVAAGPTTSARTEPYVPSVVEKHGPRAFIGKGGLGQASLNAFREFGCVYLSAVGGCAQLLADAIVGVDDVFFLDEFGVPEAVWRLKVVDFPAVVTMDAAGNTLH